MRDALHAHAQLRTRRKVAADVDGTRCHASAAELHDQTGRGPRGHRRELGVNALFPAVGGLRAETECLRGPQNLGAREVGCLEHDGRRALADLGVGAAHDAADALRRLGVGDHEHRRVERALLPVQRAQGLACARAPRRQPCAAQPGMVVDVHRASEVVHDVVRDVDDVRDRSHAGGVHPRLQPERRGAHGHVLEDACGEARAELLVVDRDRDPVGREAIADRGRLAVVERREIDAEDRVDVARDAAHGEQVGPVGGHLELEHVVDERQARCEWLAGPPPVAEHDDAVALGRDVQLSLGQDHAVGGLAAQLGARDATPVQQRRPRQRDGHGVPRGEIPGTADDRSRRGLADVDVAQLQAVGVRVLAGLEHVPGDDQLPDAVLRRQPAALDALDLVAGEREPLDELLQRRQLGEVVGQPLQRDLHRTAPRNCSRKRTSLS